MSRLNSTDLLWDKFITRLASKLLAFKDNHNSLIRWINAAYEENDLASPLKNLCGMDAWGIQDIDPFSIIAQLALKMDNRRRRAVFRAIADMFDIPDEVPMDFPGMPILEEEDTVFFNIENTGLQTSYIASLWELFEWGVIYADSGSDESRVKFIKCYDQVQSYGVLGWKISLGLFLIRPFAFPYLDSNTRQYLESSIDLETLGDKDAVGGIEPLHLGDRDSLNGEQYLRLRNRIRSDFGSHGYFAGSFIDFVDASNKDDFPQDVVRSKSKGSRDQYTKSDFLDEVFMSSLRYDEVKSLLLRKHNIILQGAPGVGKTFSAKRLCYSIMGCKDESRIMFVQFHQSYTYEDFMMGYRPDAASGDFILTTGVFYDFCEKARRDASRQYFMLIDEINRGNISKIFGELMMAIEGDKRNQSVVLQYTKEAFAVPDNLYLVGMMNTADRSLALMDYALRRRFSFITMDPAFDSDQFIRYQAALHSSKFDRLVQVVKDMNEAIKVDLTLGAGFMIGHSYLCNCDEATDEWLGSVVFYDLIPLLEEYWFEEPGKLNLWKTELYKAIE